MSIANVERSNGTMKFCPGSKRTAPSKALLTRRLLAMKASRNEVMSFANQLVARAHRRELAMLQLNLMHEPEAALKNALRNWEKQEEPIDARLLLRSALAGGNPPVA